MNTEFRIKYQYYHFAFVFQNRMYRYSLWDESYQKAFNRAMVLCGAA